MAIMMKFLAIVTLLTSIYLYITYSLSFGFLWKYVNKNRYLPSILYIVLLICYIFILTIFMKRFDMYVSTHF